MGEPMDRSNRYLAGPLTNFDDAFPTLSDGLIEYSQSGNTASHSSPRKEEHTFDRSTSLRGSGGLIRCENPHCYRGGFEIDHDVHDMVRAKLVSKEFTTMCPGDEGSPKGRNIGRKCLNILHYRI